MSFWSFITRLIDSTPEASLHRRFIKRRDNESLMDLLSFVVDRGQPFPIDEPKIREVLFGLTSWRIKAKYQEQFFSYVEGYLFGNARHSTSNEWHWWLRTCRSLGRRIDVMNSTTSKAILDAQRADKFEDLSKEDYEYLLGCYLQSYGELLEKMGAEHHHEMLPVLLEFATIVQFVEPNESALKVLKRWAEHPQSRPRALTSMSDEQAYYAPIRGVGSPNGVSVTFYHDPMLGTPVQISCAGTTCDPALNAQVFTSLFATALACDSEPTFVTTSGCTLSLAVVDRGNTAQSSEQLLAAVIGPAGPVQPTSGTPALGMDAKEADVLVRDLFERFQESTGLVHVMNWEINDARQLEKRIIQALKLKDNSIHVIKSDSRHSEGSGVVHAMPLLHRDLKGTVIPIEIEVPYHLLGSQKVFKLLRTARQAYMQQLITAGQRRKAMAEQVYKEQAEQVKQWTMLDDLRKDAICRQQPWIPLNQQYNFEFGIISIIDPPEMVEHRYFEEHRRPEIRDWAKQCAEQFAELCEKLKDLNKEGGKADILTFKLLIDSMIRQASLSIAHPEFQIEYQNWVKINSIPVWAILEGWARNRGLSPKTLAADNIIYNVRVEVNRKSVLVQPWVMVDLHDFVVHINCQQGLMEVLPSGKTKALVDTLVSDAAHGITDLKSLHDSFCSWASRNLGLYDARQRQENAVRSEILNDSKLSALIQLFAAKRLLLEKGNPLQAAKIIDKIRRFDLAPIYFWGAVAHQYQFLEKNHTEFNISISNLQGNARVQQLLSASLGTLVTHLQLSELGSSFSPSLNLHLPVDKEAKRYIDQLRAKDRSFVRDLLEQSQSGSQSLVRGQLQVQLDIQKLEQESSEFSSDEEERFNAAIFALSSLEFLKLAEYMKDTARELPFTGELTRDLRKDLERIVEQFGSLSFRDSSLTQQIDEFARAFN